MTISEKVEDLKGKFERLFEKFDDIEADISSYIEQLDEWKEEDDGSNEWRTGVIKVDFEWTKGFQDDLEYFRDAFKTIVSWLDSELEGIDDCDTHKLIIELNKGLKRYRLAKSWIVAVSQYLEASAWTLENNNGEKIDFCNTVSDKTEKLVEECQDNSDDFWDPDEDEDDDESDDEEYEEYDEDDESEDDEVESDEEDESDDEDENEACNDILAGLDDSDDIDENEELSKLDSGEAEVNEDIFSANDEESNEKKDKFEFLFARNFILYQFGLIPQIAGCADVKKLKKQHKVPAKNNDVELLIFSIMCHFFYKNKMLHDPTFTIKEDPILKPKFIEYACGNFLSFIKHYSSNLMKYFKDIKKVLMPVNKIVEKYMNKWGQSLQNFLVKNEEMAYKTYKQFGDMAANAEIIRPEEAYDFAKRYKLKDSEKVLYCYLNWFLLVLVDTLIAMKDKADGFEEDNKLLSKNPLSIVMKQYAVKASKEIMEGFYKLFKGKKSFAEIAEILRNESSRNVKTWEKRFKQSKLAVFDKEK